MKWFKHDADASSDAKIRKLIMKYGTDGYAIYFHCLELIVGNISESNITFELEHDAEIIADTLRVVGKSNLSAVDYVGEIMRYMVFLGLFESYENHITCYKLRKRLDSSMSSSPKMRSLITKARESHDIVMTESCKTRLDKTRLEENIQESANTEPDGLQPLKHNKKAEWYKKSDNAESLRDMKSFITTSMLENDYDLYTFSEVEKRAAKSIIDKIRCAAVNVEKYGPIVFDSGRFKCLWDVYMNPNFWLDKGGPKTVQSFYRNLNYITDKEKQ